MKLLDKIDRLIEEAKNFFSLSVSDNEKLDDYKSGVYSSVTLDPVALQKIWTYLNRVGLPMQHIQNAHVTVIYSRTRPIKVPKANDITGYVKPKKFGIFGKGTKQEPYVLVLELTSPALQKAHMDFRKQGLQPTHRDYQPHMTLVLDINRLLPGLQKLSEKKKLAITNIFDKMLPELPQKIKIQKHTVEPIKPRRH